MFGGRGAARDLEGLRQRLTFHLSTQTLLVEGGLEEARVAVELHQVEDLRRDEQILKLLKRSVVSEGRTEAEAIRSSKKHNTG